MRDYKNYSKTLNQWTSQLNLQGKMIQKKSLNSEMIKSVYLILIGNSNSLSEFSKRLKTHNVDLDSKGKPCKEKMSRNLFTVKVNFSFLEFNEVNFLEVFNYENDFELKAIVEKLFIKHDEFLNAFLKLFI